MTSVSRKRRVGLQLEAELFLNRSEHRRSVIWRRGRTRRPQRRVPIEIERHAVTAGQSGPVHYMPPGKRDAKRVSQPRHRRIAFEQVTKFAALLTENRA
jgi:hypothetical protein